MYEYHNLYNSSLDFGYLDYFLFFTIINDAVVNFLIYISWFTHSMIVLENILRGTIAKFKIYLVIRVEKKKF